jgi:IS30 family transposase
MRLCTSGSTQIKVEAGTYTATFDARRSAKKRYTSGQQRRGAIPDRVGIEERPASVEARAQIGHWEMDSIVGCNYKGFLVSMVERKSRIAFTAHVARKTAELVAAAIIETPSPIAGLVMTLTFGNGKKCTLHKKIAEKLGCRTYFADLYTSCQRATNESTSGLIRQYVPKKTSFTDLTKVHTRWIDAQLNSRPRKCLYYQTPSEVLLKSIIGRGVALRA